MPKMQLQGKVVSNKMQKTVVVEVEKMKEHPKYKRRYKVWKKYKAHVEDGQYQIGDEVLIEECRPISKEKKWKVVKVVKPAAVIVQDEPVAEKTEEQV